MITFNSMFSFLGLELVFTGSKLCDAIFNIHVNIFWKQTIKPPTRKLCPLKEDNTQDLSPVGGFCHVSAKRAWPKHIDRVSLVDGPGSGEEVLPSSFGSNRTELSGVLAWDPDSPGAAKESHCTEELQKARGGCRGTRACCLVTQPIPAKGAAGTRFLLKKCHQSPRTPQQLLNMETAVAWLESIHPALTKPEREESSKAPSKQRTGAVTPATASVKIRGQIWLGMRICSTQELPLLVCMSSALVRAG